MKSAKRVNPVLVIFAATLILRIIAIAIAWSFHRYPQPLEYEVVVSNWLEGKGFVYFHYGAWYSSFLNPLYAFLCIAVYKLFGHYHLLILLMQAIFAGLLCVCIFYIGCRIDRRIGIVAALLTMVHPGIFYYDVFYLHPLSMDAFLFALIILVFMRLAERGIFMNQLAAGLAIGFQMYERGTIAFFVPLAMAWLKYFSSFKDSIGRWLKKCAIMTVVTILLLLPWTIRNFVIHKELVPVCTTIAEVLWRGNNPLTTGTAYAANGKPMFFAAPEEFQKRLTALDEMGQTRAFREEAIAFIRQSPPRFIHLTLEKMMLFWWFSPLTGIEYKFAYLGIVKLAYAVMMVISLIGMILMIVRRTHVNLVFLMLIMFFTVTLGQSFFYVQQKHRWEMEPLLFIFTSSAIVYCYDSLFNRKGLPEK